jgi:dTDP-4-amino-4,6-dideoxygalactose transaminase
VTPPPDDGAAAPIPFVDLAAGIRPRRAAYLAAIGEVLDSCSFAGGAPVERFEQAFAAACGTPHAIAVKNGTDALLLMLRAAGIAPGDEVILPTNSFYATAEAVSHAGATPIFADVEDDTLLLDVDDVARRIGPRTRAVIAVHLYGQLADVESLEALCRARGLLLFEDAAQAHGATRRGRTAGSIGLAAAFSFYPTKNLGAFGEGGAVTTSSAALAAAVRELRDHGQRGRHHHVAIGYNARLDSIQCACLTLRLEELPAFNAARRRLAARYRAGLAELPGLRLVHEEPAGEAVYHLFVVRIAGGRRAAVQAALGAAGVASAIHYPTPIHRQPAYGGAAGECPVAEAAAAEILSLPMYPELGEHAVDRVIAALRRALAA